MHCQKYKELVMTHISQKIVIFTVLCHATVTCMEPALPLSRPLLTQEQKRSFLKQKHPQLSYLEGHKDAPIIYAAWNPDGSVLVSHATKLIMRDGRTGEPKRILAEKWGYNPLFFSPDGSRLIYQLSQKCSYNDAILADGRTGNVIKNLIVKENQRGIIFAFSPDSTRIIQSTALYDKRDSAIIIYEAENGFPLQVIDTTEDIIFYNALAFKNNTEFVAGGRGISENTKLTLYDVGEGTKSHLIGHSGDISCVAFNANCARLATGSEKSDTTYDHNLILRDQDGDTIKALKGHKNYINVVCFNGIDLVSGASYGELVDSEHNNIMVWDIMNGSLIKTIENKERIEELIVSRDRTLLIAATPGKIFLYDGTTYEHIRTLEDTTFRALSPDGNWIAAEKDGSLVLWDLFQ